MAQLVILTMTRTLIFALNAKELVYYIGLLNILAQSVMPRCPRMKLSEKCYGISKS